MTEHNNPQDNVTVPRELLRQVINAACSPYCAQDLGKLIPALRTALEQPAVKTEPIGEIVWDCNAYPWKRISCLHESDIAGLPIGTKVYTTPQAQPAPVQEPDVDYRSMYLKMRDELAAAQQRLDTCEALARSVMNDQVGRA